MDAAAHSVYRHATDLALLHRHGTQGESQTQGQHHPQTTGQLTLLTLPAPPQGQDPPGIAHASWAWQQMQPQLQLQHLREALQR